MIEIGWSGLGAAYALLIIPLGLLLYLRVPMMTTTLISLIRMTVQLLLVGFYLQFIFALNHIGVNVLWLLVMVLVADASVLSGSGLRFRRIGLGVFIAALVGTSVPLLIFTGLILRLPHMLDAQYLIPIAGMILGNCLRADIVGLTTFYGSMRKNRHDCEQCLVEGATLVEMTRPWLREAMQASLAPTVATMATTGVVALPGMMTGVILAGADPFVAVKYQIAIMIAIFAGTSLTVILAIRLTLGQSFDEYGLLDEQIFAKSAKTTHR